MRIYSILIYNTVLHKWETKISKRHISHVCTVLWSHCHILLGVCDTVNWSCCQLLPAVSATSWSDHIVTFCMQNLICRTVSWSHYHMLLAESFTLWADHRWGDSSFGHITMCSREPDSAGAGQLPSYHGRFPGASDLMSQSAAHRTLRLPTHHQGRYPAPQGNNNVIKLKLSSPIWTLPRKHSIILEGWIFQPTQWLSSLPITVLTEISCLSTFILASFFSDGA